MKVKRVRDEIKRKVWRKKSKPVSRKSQPMNMKSEHTSLIKKGGNAEEKKMNVVGRGKMRLTSENQDEPRNNTACHASQCLTPSALSVGLRRET